MLKIFSDSLNKRVTIQKAVKAQTSKGVIIYEYPTAIDNVCAKIESYGAFIRNGQAEKVSELEYRITIRYRKNFKLHDRIIYQGRIFEQILPARDLDEQHKFLQLTCREKIRSD